MNLFQTIINYYQGEARHGFWATLLGGLLLIGSLVLWKWASPLTLLKGFAIPMFLFGLLMGIGGLADHIYTKKATPGKIALYQKDPITFLKQEKIKTEKTHRGWHGIRIFWGVLGFGGLLLALLIRKPFWIGAGLGTLALAVLLSLFEFFSMRFNEQYYHVIQSASAQKALQVTPEDGQQQIEHRQNTIEAVQPKVHNGTQPNLKHDTLSKPIIPFDSLKSLSAQSVTAVTIKNITKFNTPDSLQNLTLINEPIPVYVTNKKRKVLDYYNSDLIQANGVNARHCWFSKKYIKE